MKKLRPKFFRYHLKKIILDFIYKFKRLDFTGYCSAEYLGLANSGATGYEPCYYNITNYIKRVKPQKMDSFLDIGSGKGCALFYAKKFPFERIDGVELSKELYDISTKNVAIIGDDRIHIFNEDATIFDGYDNYNFFFLYNPCFKKAMEKIVSKIVNSYNTNRRRIIVVYVTAKSKQIFLNAGFNEIYNHKNDCILELK